MRCVSNFLHELRGRVLRIWLAIALVGLSVSACGLLGDQKAEDPVLPAEQWYNEGLELVSKGSYEEAADKFFNIQRQHPYSEWAQKGLLMQAYSRFRAREYELAIGDAQTYVSLYPSSEDAPYALYLIGESNFLQITDVSRDQSTAERAKEAFQTLVNNYPDSRYAEEARQKIKVSVDQLAGREIEIGRYYLENKEYLAAINRFKVVVQNYQKTRFIEEALFRLTEAYLSIGLTNEAQTATAVLGHNYPKSQWYLDAYTLLESRGLKEKTDKGSWLSKIANN